MTTKPYVLNGYRALRVEEMEAAEKAINWLKKRHLRIEEIAFLTIRNVDQENMIVSVKREGKLATLWLHTGYQGSPFEHYMQLFPSMKSNRFIFVRWAFTGRKQGLCQHIQVEKVREIVAQNRKSLLTIQSTCTIIKVAKVNLHITN